MEKPGGLEGAPRRLNPKARSKLDLIKPLGGPQGGADGPQAQEMPQAVPHVLAADAQVPRAWFYLLPGPAAQGKEWDGSAVALQLAL